MSEVTTDEYFGGCAECGKTDGYLNLRSNHVFVCDEHKTAWCVGSNLFSCWQEESEEDWKQNEEKLRGYREVNPIHAPVSYCERCNAQTIGTSPTAPHSPLCRNEDGSLTELSDKAVKQALAVLERRKMHLANNPTLDVSDNPFLDDFLP